MNMDGDNIKIFPKRKTAYDSNGRTLMFINNISMFCNKYHTFACIICAYNMCGFHRKICYVYT